MEIVGHLKSSLSGQITIHFNATTREISLTASSNHWTVTAQEAETLARVIGFLVVAGTGSVDVFTAPTFEKNYAAFSVVPEFKTKYGRKP